MEIMHTDKAPAAVGPYSQAVKTGNLLFCSGQIGLNPATGEMVGTTVAEQAKQVMENVKALLENAGATFDNVVVFGNNIAAKLHSADNIIIMSSVNACYDNSIRLGLLDHLIKIIVLVGRYLCNTHAL